MIFWLLDQVVNLLLLILTGTALLCLGYALLNLFFPKEPV